MSSTGDMRALTGRSQERSIPLFRPTDRGSRIGIRATASAGTSNEIYVRRLRRRERERDPHARSQYSARDLDARRQIAAGRARTTAPAPALGPASGRSRGAPAWAKLGARRRLLAGASMGEDGELAFTATEPDRPAELYYMRRRTGLPGDSRFQRPGRRARVGQDRNDRWREPTAFTMDGVVTYPPGFHAGQEVSAGAVYSRRPAIGVEGGVL